MTPDPAPYRGRFAPSPSGPLHAGSIVAALASYVDARAHRGTWLIRIEDLDAPRVVAGAAEHIIDQLDRLGLHADAPIVWQSRRLDLYKQQFERLRQAQRVYGCACSRKDIAEALAALKRRPAHKDAESPYPGTCRNGTGGRTPRAWRFRVEAGEVGFVDRWYGPCQQDAGQALGDFVLLRADGIWSYQWAVVIDDIDQAITDVVRGEDLLSSTPRQILLYQALGQTAPRWMHVPVLKNALGQKLSKQTGAPEVDVSRPQTALNAAWRALGMQPFDAASTQAWLRCATEAWRERWRID